MMDRTAIVPAFKTPSLVGNTDAERVISGGKCLQERLRSLWEQPSTMASPGWDKSSLLEGLIHLKKYILSSEECVAS